MSCRKERTGPADQSQTASPQVSVPWPARDEQQQLRSHRGVNRGDSVPLWQLIPVRVRFVARGEESRNLMPLVELGSRNNTGFVIITHYNYRGESGPSGAWAAPCTATYRMAAGRADAGVTPP